MTFFGHFKEQITPQKSQEKAVFFCKITREKGQETKSPNVRREREGVKISQKRVMAPYSVCNFFFGKRKLAKELLVISS